MSPQARPRMIPRPSSRPRPSAPISAMATPGSSASSSNSGRVPSAIPTTVRPLNQNNPLSRLRVAKSQKKCPTNSQLRPATSAGVLTTSAGSGTSHNKTPGLAKPVSSLPGSRSLKAVSTTFQLTRLKHLFDLSDQINSSSGSSAPFSSSSTPSSSSSSSSSSMTMEQPPQSNLPVKRHLGSSSHPESSASSPIAKANLNLKLTQGRKAASASGRRDNNTQSAPAHAGTQVGPASIQPSSKFARYIHPPKQRAGNLPAITISANMTPSLPSPLLPLIPVLCKPPARRSSSIRSFSPSFSSPTFDSPPPIQSPLLYSHSASPSISFTPSGSACGRISRQLASNGPTSLLEFGAPKQAITSKSSKPIPLVPPSLTNPLSIQTQRIPKLNSFDPVERHASPTPEQCLPFSILDAGLSAENIDGSLARVSRSSGTEVIAGWTQPFHQNASTITFASVAPTLADTNDSTLSSQLSEITFFNVPNTSTASLALSLVRPPLPPPPAGPLPALPSSPSRSRLSTLELDDDDFLPPDLAMEFPLPPPSRLLPLMRDSGNPAPPEFTGMGSDWLGGASQFDPSRPPQIPLPPLPSGPSSLAPRFRTCPTLSPVEPFIEGDQPDSPLLTQEAPDTRTKFSLAHSNSSQTSLTDLEQGIGEHGDVMDESLNDLDDESSSVIDLEEPLENMAVRLGYQAEAAVGTEESDEVDLVQDEDLDLMNVGGPELGSAFTALAHGEEPPYHSLPRLARAPSVQSYASAPGAFRPVSLQSLTSPTSPRFIASQASLRSAFRLIPSKKPRIVFDEPSSSDEEDFDLSLDHPRFRRVEARAARGGNRDRVDLSNGLPTAGIASSPTSASSSSVSSNSHSSSSTILFTPTTMSSNGNSSSSPSTSPRNSWENCTVKDLKLPGKPGSVERREWLRGNLPAARAMRVEEPSLQPLNQLPSESVALSTVPEESPEARRAVRTTRGVKGLRPLVLGKQNSPIERHHPHLQHLPYAKSGGLVKSLRGLSYSTSSSALTSCNLSSVAGFGYTR